jgi:hypothetical protein
MFVIFIRISFGIAEQANAKTRSEHVTVAEI